MDAIETAVIEVHKETPSSETLNGFPRSVSTNSEDDKNLKAKTKGLPNGLRKGAKKYPNYIQISLPEDSKNKYPLEWWKTGIAFVYALFNMVLTTVMITVVHERVPPKEVSPPLPDKFFDYIDRITWAFSVSEINGMILVGLWFIQWLFLRYKSIVGRRYFFIVGTLYLYRCITMYVTTLPVPGMHFQCAPKTLILFSSVLGCVHTCTGGSIGTSDTDVNVALYSNLKYIGRTTYGAIVLSIIGLNGDSYAKAQRILRLITGGGLTITGSHILCGDFLYSGHTVILTLTYLFIKEYSPRHFWWYHIFCWLLSASGVVCILVAHEHYTVDVIVAYYITTRLFWWYHAMANEKALKTSTATNLLSRTWWFPVFAFFEKNVQGCVPCSFSWPISWPPSCFKSSCKTYSRVQKTGEDVEKCT